MSALKNELVYDLLKSTNVKTSQSKMDGVFMIITLLNLGLDFENIREQILIRPIAPTFDEVFGLVTSAFLHHDSIPRT